MLISQSQLFGEATAFLNEMDRLEYDDYENIYPATMVNITHNPRLSKDLIQLESFLQYGQLNGIDDGGYAIYRVCEANEVPLDNLAFTVHEENLYIDPMLLNTCIDLSESNFEIFISPISSDSIFYTRLTEALQYDMAYDGYENSPNLQAYVNESILDTARTKVESGAKKVKGAVSGGVKEVAGKLASIRKQISEKTKKLWSSTGTAKVAIKRQIDKLKGALKALGQKAGHLKDAAVSKVKSIGSSIGNKASGAASAVKGTARTVGNKISSAASSVGNAAGSAKDTISNKASSAADYIGDKAKAVKQTASNAVDSIKNKIG